MTEQQAEGITEHDPRPASMLQPVTFGDSTGDELARPFASVREYRVLSNDEDPGVVLLGPCAYTIGCLFDRKFYDEDGVALGTLIDAAVEHEGVQGQQAHADIAAMDAVMDAETGATQSPVPVPAESEALSTGAAEALPVAAALLDREALGQMVRTVWVSCARELPDPKPSNIAPWEEISEWDREADRRIGEVVAAHAAAVVSLEMHRLSSREIEAAEAERDEARAKLAAVAAYCHGAVEATSLRWGEPTDAKISAGEILAITGTGEGKE